jgi:guanylate kinase
MRESNLPCHYTVTATTRPRRDNEVDGVDYLFYTESQFTAMILENEFLEHAEVYGNLYGVPKRPVNQALENGIDVIIKADIQGAATIRQNAPDAVLIFLDPPDIPELTRRLTERMTESPDALKIRIATARREMEEGSKFDHRVVNHNGRLDDAVAEIKQIISQAKTQPTD